MDIYASDEEKGEEIKQWWRDNGRSVIMGCVLGLAVIFSGRYWINYQHTLSSNASLTYRQVAIAISEGETSLAEDKTQQLLSEFSSTPYATFAAFEMAVQSTEKGDSTSAQAYLEWVLTNAELLAHKELARLRLAQLLMSSEQFEQSLDLIKQSESTAFTSLLEELRGDIFVAQGNIAEARKAYQSAMIDLMQGEPRKGILQFKLNDVAE